ncbi:hypothetical protein HDK90DRAFT_470992 [Phyllosticta capitalensis]|uniref:Uncharacterized protein n=1 Tax=Phyllosticta capitalensis TaxID=121624 RepID=A0ABR1Y8V4_9PEZI
MWLEDAWITRAIQYAKQRFSQVTSDLPQEKPSACSPCLVTGTKTQSRMLRESIEASRSTAVAEHLKTKQTHSSSIAPNYSPSNSSHYISRAILFLLSTSGPEHQMLKRTVETSAGPSQQQLGRSCQPSLCRRRFLKKKSETATDKKPVPSKATRPLSRARLAGAPRPTTLSKLLPNLYLTSLPSLSFFQEEVKEAYRDRQEARRPSLAVVHHLSSPTAPKGLTVVSQKRHLQRLRGHSVHGTDKHQRQLQPDQCLEAPSSRKNPFRLPTTAKSVLLRAICSRGPTTPPLLGHDSCTPPTTLAHLRRATRSSKPLATFLPRPQGPVPHHFNPSAQNPQGSLLPPTDTVPLAPSVVLCQPERFPPTFLGGCHQILLHMTFGLVCVCGPLPTRAASIKYSWWLPSNMPPKDGEKRSYGKEDFLALPSFSHDFPQPIREQERFGAYDLVDPLPLTGQPRTTKVYPSHVTLLVPRCDLGCFMKERVELARLGSTLSVTCTVKAPGEVAQKFSIFSVTFTDKFSSGSVTFGWVRISQKWFGKRLDYPEPMHNGSRDVNRNEYHTSRTYVAQERLCSPRHQEEGRYADGEEDQARGECGSSLRGKRVSVLMLV